MIILLIIIAIGVLLCSEAGQALLGTIIGIAVLVAVIGIVGGILLVIGLILFNL